jgi:hypothetical protein
MTCLSIVEDTTVVREPAEPPSTQTLGLVEPNTISLVEHHTTPRKLAVSEIQRQDKLWWFGVNGSPWA